MLSSKFIIANYYFPHNNEHVGHFETGLNLKEHNCALMQKIWDILNPAVNCWLHALSTCLSTMRYAILYSLRSQHYQSFYKVCP